ncbi:tetratricopeptide repeat protein, partial [bacterium]|nr:tetratricopeptide repeat protein [bacterium]
LIKRYTENIEAFNLYLKGRYFWNKRTEDGLKKGIEYFKQAIEIDPNYALAYAGLADCYIVLPFYSSYSPKEAYPKAQDAVSRALELDNKLAEAYTSLGGIKLWYDWDWPGAKRSFKQAIQLNPSLAIAHHWYSQLLKSIGQIDKAIEEIRIALEHDPLSVIINSEFGAYLYLEGRYDEAIKQLRKTLEIDSEHRGSYSWLGRVYLQTGKYKEAIEMFQRIESPNLAYAFTASGNKDKALVVLRNFMEKSSREYVDPYAFAIIYFGLGEINKTFEALEKGYQERSVRLVDYAYLDPYWDGIRSDPRFKALIKKLNFE